MVSVKQVPADAHRWDVIEFPTIIITIITIIITIIIIFNPVRVK